MKIEFIKGNVEELKENVVIVNYEDSNTEFDVDVLNSICKKFEGKYNSIEQTSILEKEELKNITLVGLGKKEKLTEENMRVIGGNLIKKIKSNDSEDVHIVLDDVEKCLAHSFVEGIILGDYEFNKYKSCKKEDKNININIYSDLEIDEEYDELKNLAEAVIIGRNLVNEPANILYPETLAKEVIRLGKEYGFEVEVYEEEKIKSLGMEAFLSVAKGSVNKPRFIVMRYTGNEEEEEVLGLVGKGLTYDSGGYSIKPTNSMLDMKTDMAGAASVIGAMCAISKNKISKNVISVVAACENVISNDSYKPGDIIGSMGRKTIEVVNTDAEGRLTLADAVYYIINVEKVSKVVDIATLTGAALHVLGSVSTPVISNNDDFYNELEKSCEKAGERIWRLPIYEEFKKMIKGNEADLKNSGGREAGCITAGLFVGEFVGDTPWIHMDIAGTSVSNKSKGYKSKGGTGEGVRSLYYLAKD